jgi:hypothetical protein
MCLFNNKPLYDPFLRMYQFIYFIFLLLLFCCRNQISFLDLKMT